jgi:putative NIF3 family GTP cyclohydrolase 1 type 2
MGPTACRSKAGPKSHTIVSGVTASLALIEAAVAARADAIFVHHGLFWRGQDGRVTGWMKQRLALLLAHDINLYAYHLPLDAHPELGNNAQLGLQLGLAASGRFGEQDLGFIGSRADGGRFCRYGGAGGARAAGAGAHRGPGRAGAKNHPPGRLVHGRRPGYFEAAIAAGADAFITGEISEPQAHYAREMGVAFIACGHHASERYGAPAVAGQVAAQLGLAHQFIDIDNPA